MRIENVYSNRHLIPTENEGNFIQKAELNTIEHIGLEAIAVEFMHQYNAENFGYEESRDEIRKYIRWNTFNVDILDGYYDTFEFDGYLIGSFWMTENGIPMLTAYEIPEDCEDWRDCDYMGDFTARMFRLF